MKKTVFSVATITALTGTSLTANAEEVIVKDGDTLWGIANEVGTTVEALKQQNNLKSDLIKPEDVLTYDLDAEVTYEEDAQGTYTVRSGDTLWAIAEKFGLSLDELYALNDLSSDLIHPGLVLNVGGEVAAAPVVNEVEVVEENNEVEVEEVSAESAEVEVEEVQEFSGAYVVEAGDTLYSIARATGVSVDELKALNGLSNDLITVGQVLVLEGAVQEVEEVEVVEENNEVEVEEVEVVEAEEVAEEVNVDAEREAKAEEERVEAEQAAAAQIAAEKAEAERVAAEKAEAERAEQERIAAAKAEEERLAAERAEKKRIAKEQAAAEKAEQERIAAEEAAQQVQEQQNQPAASAPVSNASAKFGGLTNHYLWGWCAWYVFEQRESIGKPVSNMWGDANNWASNASADGFTVSSTPAVGSIAQSYAGTNGAGAEGHVAIVESINGDGSITVSEMGWNGGVGVVNYRTISASQVSSHNFIH